MSAKEGGLMLFFSLVVLLAGCVSPDENGKSGNDPILAGRRIYLNKCAKCHALYAPANYSQAEWSYWMKKMRVKARLSERQNELVEQYAEEKLRQ
jgi:hypothetical protein